MNKTIAQATKEEIAQAYRNKVPYLISYYRKSMIERFDDLDTGEIKYHSLFGLKRAFRCDLAFEWRVWNSNKMRKERLKERVNRIVRSEKAIFLTLTFNNEFFQRETSEETRRRYISRFLREQCSEYVANVDYGDKGNREHYHALVIPKGERINYAPYCSFFDGSRIYAQSVRVNEKSEISISLYINKLTNHALKDSGQYKRLIYSRVRKPIH